MGPKHREIKATIQTGDVIAMPTTAGGITSGEGLNVGNIGIATCSVTEGDPLELAPTSVYKLTKASAAILGAEGSVRLNPTAC